MSEQLLIRNGLVALPGEEEFQAVDIRIDGETIVEIGPGLTPDAPTLQVDGCWVLPGGIDAHVHFDDPGYTDERISRRAVLPRLPAALPRSSICPARPCRR